MVPFDTALENLGLAAEVFILPVTSGYPSPKLINLVLRKRRGKAFLFEASVAREDVIADIFAQLAGHGVSRLDGVLVTHCHGDHGGSAGIVAARGYPDGERAPIYLHSAGYRFLTHPEAAFLNETHELFLTRAHWGLLSFDGMSNQEMADHQLRKQFSRYFARTPKTALKFVDQAQIPDGIWALFTPGHSNDCVLYYDEELGIAVPGDTIICTGVVEKPETHGYVIPIFTVAGQSYSMAYERYIQTIRVLRRFFETHRVRAVLPPHGKFAITRPLDWVAFAEGYFKGIYRALLQDFLSDEGRKEHAVSGVRLESIHPERRRAPDLHPEPHLRHAVRARGRGLLLDGGAPADPEDLIFRRSDAAGGLGLEEPRPGSRAAASLHAQPASERRSCRVESSAQELEL